MNKVEQAVHDMIRVKEKGTEELMDRTRGTVTVAAIGGAVGFLLGYNRKWNLILSTFIGVVAGGVLNNVIVKVRK